MSSTHFAAANWLQEAFSYATNDYDEAAGDGPPLLNAAVDSCFGRSEAFRTTTARAGNTALESARRIRSETNVSVDANPYFGITRSTLEAVIRAAFESSQMPEVLLALWSKEGSHKMPMATVEFAQASTNANAKTMARSEIYFVDLGADFFNVTTRPEAYGIEQSFPPTLIDQLCYPFAPEEAPPSDQTA